MTDNENEAIADDSMTEQIEAQYGPMSVYVSGTDSDDVHETFVDVWKTIADHNEDVMDRRAEMEVDGDSGGNLGVR